MTYNATMTAAPDHPLPNMTVREYLEQVGREAEQRIMDRANTQNAELWAKFEQIKTDLLSSSNDSLETTNATTSSTLDDSSRQDKKSRVTDYRIVLEITYQDEVHQVEVRVGEEREAKVGRSRGKQFLPGAGISLHFDQEVSTTHGRFFVHTKTGKVCFEDLGSTNKTTMSSGEGTRLLNKFEPVAIHKGITLYMGASALNILEIHESSS